LGEPLVFEVVGLDGARNGEQLVVHPSRLVLVGYSGRDQTAVQAHVDELLEHGVPAPDEVPAVWEIPVALATQAGKVTAPAGRTSGEVEPVLVASRGRVYVTVGSDHTDRELERDSMDAAKEACPKVLAERCWAVDDVRSRWDDLELTSTVCVDGDWRTYQRGSLGQLLPPEWFLERFTSEGDVVVFCGTVPAADGLETSASAFRATLTVPNGGPQLACQYDVVDQ
jgi:hypothetical protein